MLNLLKIIQFDVLFEFIYDIFLFQNLVLLKRVKYLVLLFDSNLNLPVPIVLYSVHPMQCYSRPAHSSQAGRSSQNALQCRTASSTCAVQRMPYYSAYLLVVPVPV